MGGDSTITQTPSLTTSLPDTTFTTTNSNGEPIIGISLGNGGVTLGVSTLVSASVGLGDSTITSSPSLTTPAPPDVTFTTTDSAGEPIIGVSLGSGGVTLGVGSLISGSVGLGDSTITSSPSLTTPVPPDTTFTTTNSNGEPIIGVSLGSGGVTLGVGSLISGSVGLGGDSTITS